MILNQEVELAHIEIFTIAEAPGAVALITVHAEEAVFVPANRCCTSPAFDRLVALIWTDHSLPCFELGTLLVSVNTFLFHAEAEAFL